MSAFPFPLRTVAPAVLLALATLLLTPLVARADTHTQPPQTLDSQAGSTTGTLGALWVQDQSGTADEPAKYVTFNSTTAQYVGTRDYSLPASIQPYAITAISVKANYKGPLPATQKWTWKIWNWATSTWATLGSNTNTSSTAWTTFTFNATGPITNYVRRGDRLLRVQVSSNNKTNNAKLDLESLTVTFPTGGGTPIWQPALNTRWQYQLLGETAYAATGGIYVDLCKVPYTGGSCVKPSVFDIDLYQSPDIAGNNNTPNTTAVNAIHAKGGKAICYIDSGGIENYRPDYATMKAYNDAQPAGSKLFGPNVDGYPDEYWANIHIKAHRDFMVGIQAARMDKCKAAGFDGVEFDLIDAYDTGSHPETAPLGITYAEQLDYNTRLADAAHTRGLSAALKNNTGQVADLVDNYDYVVNEQCFEFEECDNYKQFINAGKAVFQVQYSDAFPVGVFCPLANSPTWNFNSIKKGASEDSAALPYQSCR